jgi:hypothetical protein
LVLLVLLVGLDGLVGLDEENGMEWNGMEGRPDWEGKDRKPRGKRSTLGNVKAKETAVFWISKKVSILCIPSGETGLIKVEGDDNSLFAPAGKHISLER